MFDAELFVRVVLGGLLFGGLVMFMKAPESRRPEIPTSIRPFEGLRTSEEEQR